MLRSVTQSQARGTRYIRNSATGDNSIRAHRRRQHLGPRDTRLQLSLHRGFPKDLFAHLQAGCTGRHALYLLVLHNEMQRYHLEDEGIPEYINILEVAQRQSGQAGRTIADETLLLFASTAILTSERFTRANDE